MTMRFFSLTFIGCLALIGCSSDTNQTEFVRQAFTKNSVIEPDAEFSDLQSSGAPAYVAGLQNKEGAYTLFVRQAINAKGEETWISPDHLSLGMKEGMIIATRGFGNDIYAADVDKTLLALKAGHERAVTEHFITPLSGSSRVERLAFRCLVTWDSRQNVPLSVSYTADADLFSETCRNGQIDFQNLFWVDRGSRQVVQSRQWISAETGDIALRLVVE